MLHSAAPGGGSGSGRGPRCQAGAKDVNVPDIGGDEVEVTEVMVKVGDKVAAEQSLITVEGDKASMEVPAPFAGTVKEIKISTGDKVSTGTLIMVFEVEGAAPAAAPAAPAAAAPAPAAQAAKPAAAPAAKAEGKSEFAEKRRLYSRDSADPPPGARIRCEPGESEGDWP